MPVAWSFGRQHFVPQTNSMIGQPNPPSVGSFFPVAEGLLSTLGMKLGNVNQGFCALVDLKSGATKNIQQVSVAVEI